MKRLVCMVLCTGVGLASAGLPAQPALADTLCVGGTNPGCFASIQDAVDAAHDGDVIRVAPGTYAGGITIDKSVELVGAGAGATTIEGGGPVITIGEFLGSTRLNVSISELTISGGLTTSNLDSFVAEGGGVWIPLAAGNTSGATVTISKALITGNRVAPSTALPLCGFLCAFASGGGIANQGTLTVVGTRITDNVAGSTAADPSVASYAAAGGIWNGFEGTLTLRHSFVTANRVAVSPPNGRNTDGGGIVSYRTLTIEDSVISDNSSDVTASVTGSFPVDAAEANAGGLFLTPNSSTTITGSRINENGVRASNTAGDIQAESGGIDSDGSLTLRGSSVEGNTVAGSVPASSGFLAEADAGGIQVQGVTTVSDSRIGNNSLSATSPTGTALGSGGGLFNLSASLTMERTTVTANNASATGVGGFNLGGGIGNVQFGGGPPELTLTDSVITANRLTASAGISSQGGGLYTADPFSGTSFPVTLIRTVIAGNKPDQCVGC
jgi:hypothetical protein